MVDFNSFLSMITKELKATWQLYTLTEPKYKIIV